MQCSSEPQKAGCIDKLQHERLRVRATTKQHLLMSKFKMVETDISPDKEVGLGTHALGEVAEVAIRTLGTERDLKVPVLVEEDLPVLAEAEAEAEAEDLVDHRLPSNDVHPTCSCRTKILVSTVAKMDT